MLQVLHESVAGSPPVLGLRPLYYLGAAILVSSTSTAVIAREVLDLADWQVFNVTGF